MAAVVEPKPVCGLGSLFWDGMLYRLWNNPLSCGFSKWETAPRNAVNPNRKKEGPGVEKNVRPAGFDGAPSGVRTLDLGIKSPLLCQLS